MNPSIQGFIDCKRVALVGASRSGKKFGNAAAKELMARGYEVYLVNPEARQIDGQPCYPNLTALREKVDSVLVCLPASQGAGVLTEAAELGLRNVWLQQGADSPELIASGRDLGLDLVYGKCILMYAPPVRSIHRFHRAVVKLIGQL